MIFRFSSLLKYNDDIIWYILLSYHSYSHWDDGVYPDVADDDDREGQEEDLAVDQGVIHAVPRVGRHPQQRQLCHTGPVL